MADPLTIAFAYGASNVSASHAETQFRRHLPGTWLWAAVDWRDRCLAGPDETQLHDLTTRFDDPRAAKAAAAPATDGGPVTATVVVAPKAAGAAEQPTAADAPSMTVEVPDGSAAEAVVQGGLLHRLGLPIGEVASAIGFLASVGFDPRRAMREGYRRGLESVGTTVADLVNYLGARQAVGQCIVRLARDVIDEAPGSVVFVGESLGGIMLVDALAFLKATADGGDQADRDRLARVGFVFTYASQSAVLRQLRPGGTPPGPTPLTPWINVWNPDDFLSYPIEGTYEELNSGRPDKEVIDYVAGHTSLFPDSHTTYLTDPTSRLFDALRAELTARGLGSGLAA